MMSSRTQAEQPTRVRWRILAWIVVASLVAYVLRYNLSVAGPAIMRDLGLTTPLSAARYQASNNYPYKAEWTSVISDRTQALRARYQGADGDEGCDCDATSGRAD